MMTNYTYNTARTKNTTEKTGAINDTRTSGANGVMPGIYMVDSDGVLLTASEMAEILSGRR